MRIEVSPIQGKGLGNKNGSTKGGNNGTTFYTEKSIAVVLQSANLLKLKVAVAARIMKLNDEAK